MSTVILHKVCLMRFNSSLCALFLYFSWRNRWKFHSISQLFLSFLFTHSLTLSLSLSSPISSFSPSRLWIRSLCALGRVTYPIHHDNDGTEKRTMRTPESIFQRKRKYSTTSKKHTHIGARENLFFEPTVEAPRWVWYRIKKTKEEEWNKFNLPSSEALLLLLFCLSRESVCM